MYLPTTGGGRFSADKTPVKRSVTNYFYRTIASHKLQGNAIVLTGPNPLICIKRVFEAMPGDDTKLLVPEMDYDVYNSIKETLGMTDDYKSTARELNINESQLTSYLKRTSVKWENVDNIDEVGIFEDMDLMCSWVNGFSILKRRLKNQSKIETDSEKAFIFTVALRGAGGSKEYSFSCIKSLLNVVGANLDYIDYSKGTYDKGTIFRPEGYRKSSTHSHCYKHFISSKGSGNYREKVTVEGLSPEGRVSHFELITYGDSSAMMTGLIIYK